MEIGAVVRGGDQDIGRAQDIRVEAHERFAMQPLARDPEGIDIVFMRPRQACWLTPQRRPGAVSFSLETRGDPEDSWASWRPCSRSPGSLA